MGFINQLITGGAPPCINALVTNEETSDLGYLPIGQTMNKKLAITHRIHVCYINGVPWIPSIDPSHVSINIPAPWILWNPMGYSTWSSWITVIAAPAGSVMGNHPILGVRRLHHRVKGDTIRRQLLRSQLPDPPCNLRRRAVAVDLKGGSAELGPRYKSLTPWPIGSMVLVYIC